MKYSQPTTIVLPSLFFVLFFCSLSRAQEHSDEVVAPPRMPNIVFILADDLGYGEIGAFGQTKIKTPNLDRLAKEGITFTQHYCGAPVCAPSRCVLMTGKKLSHAAIRGNKEIQPEGQWAIESSEVTVAEMLKGKGYRTGGIGKWGLGPPRSVGAPENQGFDFFYGFNCQRQAHNFYPTHLWLNGEKHLLNNRAFRPYKKIKGPIESMDAFRGNEYAPNLMTNAALAFIRREQENPFFLYLPFLEPHLAMQPPEEWVNKYPKEWDKKPYLGNRGYLPHPRPRAGYAAMISHLDDHVGRVVKLIDELGLGENTLIIFTSDNGPTHDVGGVDTVFFNSAGPLQGRKGSVLEGGIRVPTIARWTERIKEGTSTDVISSFEDWMPTLANVASVQIPQSAQGLSLLPSLLGKSGQEEHEYLHWEFFGYGGQQAVRMGRWKGVRTGLKKGNTKIELYDLKTDIGETKDVSSSHPDIVKKMDHIMRNDRTKNPQFPIKMLDD